jgi:transcriptional regulator with XRE-family HTH domain
LSDTPRALFAARLVQARELRGLSQRALGDRMGLGKDKGSSRINRYEHQVTAVGFDNLDVLAKTLGVPAAYLLAESPEMADAILALAQVDRSQQADLAEVIKRLSSEPELLNQLRTMVNPKSDR